MLITAIIYTAYVIVLYYMGEKCVREIIDGHIRMGIHAGDNRGNIVTDPTLGRNERFISFKAHGIRYKDSPETFMQRKMPYILYMAMISIALLLYGKYAWVVYSCCQLSVAVGTCTVIIIVLATGAIDIIRYRELLKCGKYIDGQFVYNFDWEKYISSTHSVAIANIRKSYYRYRLYVIPLNILAIALICI